MGYAEFGGTGSVNWRVVHGNKQQKGKHSDTQPSPADGEFVVCYNGREVFRDKLAGATVMVCWPPDDVSAALSDAQERNKRDEEDERRK